MNKKILMNIIWISIILIPCMAISPVNAQRDRQAMVQTLDKSDNSLTFEVRVPWEQLELSSTTVSEMSYTQVTLPGFILTTNQGEPSLPFLSQLVGAPHGAAIDVSVIPGKKHVISLPHPILPFPTQSFTYANPEQVFLDPTSLLESQSLVVPDPQIYQSSHLYPADLGFIANQGSLRQQRLVGLVLYPIQYQPSENELIVYEKLTITMQFHGSYTTQTAARILDSEPFENLFADTLLNYQQAKKWRSSTITNNLPSIESLEDSAATLPWVPPDPAWKINIRQEGFYNLTYDQLLAADFPVATVDLSLIQMFYKGEEIAIQVLDENQNQHFDPVDKIIFFAQAMNTKYTDGNVYWLTHGQNTGLRIASRDVTPDPFNTNIASSFDASKHFEENEAYLTIIPGSNEFERFIWTFVSDSFPDRVLNFSLPAVNHSQTAQLRLSLLGYNNVTTLDPDHHAVISINGTELADVTWDGRAWMNVDVSIPPGTLHFGDNLLKIVSPPDGIYDAFYIDSFEIDFVGCLQADSDSLVFEYSQTGTWKFHIQNFSQETIMLFDVTNPAQVVALNGFTTSQLTYQVFLPLVLNNNTESFSAAVPLQELTMIPSFILNFDDHLSQPTRYWAADISTVLLPSQIVLDTPSDLHSAENKADYIIISHAQFLEQAADLSDFRVSQGLLTALIDVQDVYDQFNYGIIDPIAINRFLNYAYANWVSPAPSYVTLIGDGHYDPNNYLGYSRQSFIPPFLGMFDPNIGETAADNRYVTFVEEDELPDMFIGRLAVNSTTEAAAVINKIITYEQSPAPGDWQTRFLTVADNMDLGGSFPASSELLLDCCVPEFLSVERIYLGVTHATVNSARADVLASINSGQFLVNYLGHASYSQWAGYDSVPAYSGYLLQNSDISSLTNQDMYPIVLAMTCYDGFFHNPHPVGSVQESLAEVITKAALKGAVASWSSSGASVSAGHNILNQAFVTAAFSNDVQTIGQAVQAAKLALWASGSNLDQIDTFLLFGDPATRFFRKLTAVDDTYITDGQTPLTVSAAEGVLQNDFNPDSASLTVILVTGPVSGTVDLASDGSFAYTPDETFTELDYFTYKIFDGINESNIATVRIQLTNPMQ